MTAFTHGAHHVGLTVPNLDAAAAFFLDTLGYSKVGEKPDYPAMFVSDGTLMITLWQAENPAEAVPFDRKNVIGLHHLALVIKGADALNTLHGKLEHCEGVEIEFAPEPLGGGGTQHMMCAIPGGIRVEFIAPAS
jgi:catechol 2,3-dioxygenase-like lactoylglutathione lyase family enzyme